MKNGDMHISPFFFHPFASLLKNVSFLPFHVVSKSKDASMTKTDGIRNIIYGVMVAMAADVENRTKTMK